MKGKGGDILKGVAKPVKKIWDLKDIIGDLCILAYLIITGEPVDDLWWGWWLPEFSLDRPPW